MAISRVINFDDYQVQIGNATGDKEENIELKIDTLTDQLSIIQFPSLADRKSDFLKPFSQDHIGNPLLNMSFKRRMPWWKIIELFESSHNSDDRIEYWDVHQKKSITTIRNIFSEVYRRSIDSKFAGKYIFTIPNNWDEILQDKFLQFVPCSRDKIQLLWAPVAILIAVLKNQSTSSPSQLIGKKAVVLDFGNNGIEATRLKIKKDGSYAVPVRQSAKDNNTRKFCYSSIDHKISKSIAQLYGGISHDIIFLDGICARILKHKGKDSQEFTFGQAGSYNQLKLNNSDRDALLKNVLSEGANSVKNCIINDIIPWLKEIDQLPDIIVISGIISDIDFQDQCLGRWICKILFQEYPEIKNTKVLLANKKSCLTGALLYSQREQLGLPTYFDVLPKYEVYAKHQMLGSLPVSKPKVLVESEEIRGGKVWRPKEPIDGFSIQVMTSEFELFVRREDDKWRAIPTEKFPVLEKDEAVLIYPEMRPASGFATVIIKPKDTSDIFGRSGQLKLIWDSDKAKYKEPPEPSENYSYPFVEWIKGRFDESAEVEYVIKKFIKNRAAASKIHPLDEEEIKLLENFLEPYRTNASDYNEKYRGAFGNQYFGKNIDDDMIHAFGSILINALKKSRNEHAAGSPKQKTIRLLSFTYAYAPNEFNVYLKQKFESGYTPTQNEIIAAGRVFRKEDEVNSFLKYFVSLPGLPTKNLGWYWWAFFRFMYYNPTAAFADHNLASQFYDKMIDFLNMYKSKSVPFSRSPASLFSQLKFCLCAALYGLRIREVNSEFLGVNSSQLSDLNAILAVMPTKISFLRSMLTGMSQEQKREYDEEGLNGIIIKFLNHKASSDDVRLITNWTSNLK